MPRLKNPSLTGRLVRRTSSNIVRKIMSTPTFDSITTWEKRAISAALTERKNKLKGLLSRYRTERTAAKKFSRSSRQRNRKS